MLERPKEEILLYQDGYPLRFNYTSMVWTKNENDTLSANTNIKGERINKSFCKRFVANYPLAKVEDNQITLDTVHLMKYKCKQFQLIENGTQTLNINLKQILDQDDLRSFKIIKKMFSLDDKLNNRDDTDKKLISSKITCQFNMEDNKIIYLNLSILEYAIYVHADEIIEYLKETDQSLLFPLENAPFVAVYTSSAEHPLREDVITTWNQSTHNYSPLEVAITLNKSSVSHYLLQQIKYNVININQRVVQTLTEWLKTKINSNNHKILTDKLLIKRKTEIDVLLKISLENKEDGVSLTSLFEFYTTLAEYWYKRPVSDNSHVPTQNILSSLSQAKSILKKLNTDKLKEINPLDIQKIGIIKSQLYQDAANHGGIEITDGDNLNNDAMEADISQENAVDNMELINIKIVKTRIKSNIAALASNPNDQSLLQLTQRLATEYYRLTSDSHSTDTDENNFLKFRSDELKVFLNNISSAFTNHTNIPSIQEYLIHHFYYDKVFNSQIFNATDDLHERTIYHWMAITNQLDKHDTILSCSKDFLFDAKGNTPISLLARYHGFSACIKLLKESKPPLTIYDLWFNIGENTILHQVCRMKGKNDFEWIKEILEVFEEHHIDVNYVNALGKTPFDIFMLAIMRLNLQSEDKVKSTITNFLNKDARLSKSKRLVKCNLLNESIKADWHDLTYHLIQNAWPIEISKTTFEYLLNKKKYSLVVDLLEAYSKQAKCVTTDLCLIDLVPDVIKILLTQAYSNNQKYAFSHIVAYFEASLDILANQQVAILNLIALYSSLDSDEIKMELLESILQDKFKQAILKYQNKDDNHNQQFGISYSSTSQILNELASINIDFEENQNTITVNNSSSVESLDTHKQVNKRKSLEDESLDNILLTNERNLRKWPSGVVSYDTEKMLEQLKTDFPQSVYNNSFRNSMLLFNNSGLSPLFKEEDENELIVTQSFL